MREFDYSLDYENLNLREQPELYAIGKGEQGVFQVEPYKSELLPHWGFKNPEVAQQSAEKIYACFSAYLEEEDFVGADMARKFLQMGYTRARRYAKYPDGKKYKGEVPEDKKGESGAHGRAQKEPRKPEEEDPEKAEAARIFKEYWDKARENETYQAQKEAFAARYG